MQLIPLTQGENAIVDDEDYGFLMQRKWKIAKNGNYLYALRREKVDGGKQLAIWMHREILNPPSGLVVDHINHDGLDNRKSNLRICTVAENVRNARNKNGRFKGVSWSKVAKAWQSSIGFKGKNIHLGYFHSEIDAAQAYNEAAKVYHGDFAYLNEIPEDQQASSLPN